MVNEVAKLLYRCIYLLPQPLPPLPLPSPAPSSPASPSASITKIARPFVQHELISSVYGKTLVLSTLQ